MSQFQSLPFDIVDRIIQLSFETNGPRYRNDKRVALSLMHSCHSWRMAFFGVAFDTLVLQTSISGVLQARFAKICEWINPIDYHLDQLVRSLKISLSNWSGASAGKMDAWMRSSKSGKTCLPHLRTFVLEVGKDFQSFLQNGACDSAYILEIPSFFGFLHQIMPSVRKIIFKRYALEWPVINEAVCSPVKDQLFDLIRGINSLDLDCWDASTLFKHLDVLANGNITSLSYSNQSNTDVFSFLELVRLNAQNIVNIEISSVPPSLLCNITRRDNGEPLVYPRLKVLKHTKRYARISSTPLTNNELAYSPSGLNHFPALKILYLSDGIYPFEANILGGGPNDTVEELRLEILPTEISRDMVQSLVSTQFVKLKRVTIDFIFYSTALISGVVVVKQQRDNIGIFLKSLLQSATCLDYLHTAIPVDPDLSLVDTSCLEFGRLRHLDINENVFSFSGILQIIQSATHLERLTCRLDDKPPMIKGVGSTQLPGYMQARSPVNVNFYKLTVVGALRKAVNPHIRTMVLLAIACPNFSAGIFESHRGDYIRNLIKDLLETRMYRNYASAAKRLLDSIDQNYPDNLPKYNSNFTEDDW